MSPLIKKSGGRGKVQGWAIKSPKGDIYLWTVAPLAVTVRMLFLDDQDELPQAWPRWWRQGYRVVPVLITEVVSVPREKRVKEKRNGEV